MNLRTYNVVPTNSPLFNACIYGDLEHVKNLLASGKASPFDVDDLGWTALHVRTSHSYTCQRLKLTRNNQYAAAYYGSSSTPAAVESVCRLLLDCGADPTATGCHNLYVRLKRLQPLPDLANRVLNVFRTKCTAALGTGKLCGTRTGRSGPR